MHVEQAIELLSDHDGVLTDNWQKTFIRDVAARTRHGRELSTAQASAALRILKNLSPNGKGLFSFGVLENLLQAPTYRKQPYASTLISRREVRYIGDGKLCFRAKLYDLSQAAKTCLHDPPMNLLESVFHQPPQFNADICTMVVPVTRRNVMQIVNVIERYSFHCDNAVYEFLGNVSDTPYESAFFGDADLGVIVGDVGNNPLVGWIMEHVMGGSPV